MNNHQRLVLVEVLLQDGIIAKSMEDVDSLFMVDAEEIRTTLKQNLNADMHVPLIHHLKFVH